MRGRVLFLAWTEISGRAEEIATQLGGRHHVVYPLAGRGPVRKAFRYFASAGITLAILARERPRALIITNPPVFAGVVAYPYARLTGTRMVLDSHPGGFGLQGDRLSARLRPITRWLVRRVDATLVTEDSLRDLVHAWGGRAVILHEAPPPWSLGPPHPLGRRPRVLVVSVFQRDEPVELVVEAARRLPGIDVDITGDPAKAPPGLIDGAPPNVRFVGFLGAQAYRAALDGADVVLTLTTEPTSVVRAGYEATFGQRPLVLSDTPVLREVFPHAVHVENSVEGIEDGLRRAVREHDRLRASAPAAARDAAARWQQQLATLRERLAPEAPPRRRSRTAPSR